MNEMFNERYTRNRNVQSRNKELPKPSSECDGPTCQISIANVKQNTAVESAGNLAEIFI